MADSPKQEQERDEMLRALGLGNYVALLNRAEAAESESARLRDALEAIALRPCRTKERTGGECPDHWAVGMMTEACDTCLARQALSSHSQEGG